MHGLGELAPLLDPVPEFDAVGRTDAERQSRWRRRSVAAEVRKDLDSIRMSLRTGRPYGSQE